MNNNVCKRCGKSRIITKSWKEYAVTSNGKSELNYIQYACPNKDCQKVAELELAAKAKLTAERTRFITKRNQLR